MIGSIALLGLLLSGQPAAIVEPARYTPRPFASATLYFDATTHAVAVLGETNVVVQIRPAQYQDLRISPAVYVVCRLAPNEGLRRIGVWASKPDHLIPVDVVEYKTFDPSYVVLDIDTSYFENRNDDLSLFDHKIHIEFFSGP